MCIPPIDDNKLSQRRNAAKIENLRERDFEREREREKSKSSYILLEIRRDMNTSNLHRSIDNQYRSQNQKSIR